MTDKKPLNFDDYDRRVFEQIDVMLNELEAAKKLPMRDRIAAVVAVCRIQDFLRKGRKDDEPAAGSAVRKYATAFSRDAAGGRAKGSRRSTVPSPITFDDTEDDLAGSA